ncbi:MAG: hypothetical protein ACRDRM_11780 [Pseudonocardiaceae bacterium]
MHDAVPLLPPRARLTVPPPSTLHRLARRSPIRDFTVISTAQFTELTWVNPVAPDTAQPAV